MTPPPSLPSLPGLAWSRHKSPGFSTRVASHVSGREVRVALMNYPLYEFEAVYGGLTSSSANFAGLGASSLQSLMGFFLQLQGQFGTFLYTDPDDDTVSGQAIGVGNGTTQTFILGRTLGGFNEPVSWVTGLTNVYLNGVAQASATYVFTAPNMLAFATAPGNSVAIAADFTFAFECRFLDDQMDFEEFMSTLWKLDKMGFRSIKANTSVAGAVIPSWIDAYDVGGIRPTLFADFTTEGAGNHYYYNGAAYGGAAAYMAANGAIFARASSAYTVNASGLLASVSSNVLRFTNGGRGVPLGIFLEGASTNLAHPSGDLRTAAEGNANSGWSAQATSATPAAAGSAPDGVSAATIVVSTAGTGDHERYNGSAYAATGAFTMSLYAKPDAASWFGGDDGTGINVWFNLATGAVGTLNSGFTAALAPGTNGFYRPSWTKTYSGQNLYPSLIPLTANNQIYNYNAAGTESIYAWGYQFEQLPFASSYLSTTTASASRVAESYTRSRTSPTSLTKLIAGVTPPGVGSEQVAWQTDDGTMNNRIRVTYESPGHLHVVVTAGGTTQADLDLGAVATGTAFALAFSAQVGSFAASLNGGAVVSTSSGIMPGGITTDRLGSGLTAGEEWFSTIAVDAEWSDLLATGAQLQALAVVAP